MAYDLVIRRGTVVERLGGQPFVGDVAVKDGVIAAPATVSGDTAREIQATGRPVTTGFADMHTPT
jgi:N-acyl-D-aspartate/D-glutamate deacylase